MVRCGSVRRSFEPSIVWLILTLIGGSRRDPDCMLCERITTKLGRFSSHLLHIYWKSLAPFFKMVVFTFWKMIFTYPHKKQGWSSEANKWTKKMVETQGPWRTSAFKSAWGSPTGRCKNVLVLKVGGILLRCSKIVNIPSLKLTVCTWKLMVGILLSFWEDPFSGSMLVSGRVVEDVKVFWSLKGFPL